MTNCASSRSLLHVTTRTGSPLPASVKSVLPLRAMLFDDDAGGGVEDVAGRAVVLFELDDPRAGKVALEIEDVVDVRAAEAVDRLILVADRDDVPPLARPAALISTYCARFVSWYSSISRCWKRSWISSRDVFVLLEQLRRSCR